MDTRLLRHYESELGFLREMGAEFAAAYPKIAARLGMDGIEVLDPYVERLLEGSAFLAARVQLELELQQPAFTAHLLEIVYPHYLSCTPSMMVAQLMPDTANAALAGGHVIARHTHLRSTIVEGAQSPCLFRTACDMTLWPVEIADAEYIDGRGALVAAGVAGDTPARGGIRLRLRRSGGADLSELALDRMTLFLGGRGATSWALHEALATQVTGTVARSTDRRADWVMSLRGGVVPRGQDPDEALLPLPPASFDGHRLLQEYFALPERFHFVDLLGLGPALSRSAGAEVDIYILLRDGAPDLASAITTDAFALHCVPAVNLFPKRCDRVQISPAATEHQVVADRTAPMDYEIHAITHLTGISGEGDDDVPFAPFYSADDFTPASGTSGAAPAYYTVARRMRQRTERERLKGARTSYLGAETYVSLVDPAHAPYADGLSQLSVRAMVTNRDLPMMLPTGAPDVFHLPDGGPVAQIRTPVPPSRPRPTMAQGDAAWRLIGHLSLNYLSIADTAGGDEGGGGGGGGAALREMVGLYAPPGDRAVANQVDGIVGVASRPIVRRMADKMLSTAVRGLEITLTFDESLFEGTSPYVLGSVLERFLCRHVAINSFTETVLTTHQRGEIARWPPRTGLGRII